MRAARRQDNQRCSVLHPQTQSVPGQGRNKCQAQHALSSSKCSRGRPRCHKTLDPPAFRSDCLDPFRERLHEVVQELADIIVDEVAIFIEELVGMAYRPRADVRDRISGRDDRRQCPLGKACFGARFTRSGFYRGLRRCGWNCTDLALEAAGWHEAVGEFDHHGAAF
jgi:hypothetical protein